MLGERLSTCCGVCECVGVCSECLCISEIRPILTGMQSWSETLPYAGVYKPVFCCLSLAVDYFPQAESRHRL